MELPRELQCVVAQHASRPVLNTLHQMPEFSHISAHISVIYCPANRDYRYILGELPFAENEEFHSMAYCHEIGLEFGQNIYITALAGQTSYALSDREMVKQLAQNYAILVIHFSYELSPIRLFPLFDNLSTSFRVVVHHPKLHSKHPQPSTSCLPLLLQLLQRYIDNGTCLGLDFPGVCDRRLASSGAIDVSKIATFMTLFKYEKSARNAGILDQPCLQNDSGKYTLYFPDLEFLSQSLLRAHLVWPQDVIIFAPILKCFELSLDACTQDDLSSLLNCFRCSSLQSVEIFNAVEHGKSALPDISLNWDAVSGLQSHRFSCNSSRIIFKKVEFSISMTIKELELSNNSSLTRFQRLEFPNLINLHLHKLPNLSSLNAFRNSPLKKMAINECPNLTFLNNLRWDFLEELDLQISSDPYSFISYRNWSLPSLKRLGLKLRSPSIALKAWSMPRLEVLAFDVKELRPSLCDEIDHLEQLVNWKNGKSSLLKEMMIKLSNPMDMLICAYNCHQSGVQFLKFLDSVPLLENKASFSNLVKLLAEGIEVVFS